jgi:acyl-coenzyme A synthetase/AMP-(fatty) acid ligase
MRFNHTIFEQLRLNAESVGSNTAIRDGELSLTWVEMLHSASRMAKIIHDFMDDHHFESEKKVIVRGDGSICHVLLLISLLLARVTYVPYNRTLARSATNYEFDELLNLVVEDNKIQFSIRDEMLFLVSFADVVIASGRDEISETSKQDFAAAFYFTSGTTGTPKIIVSSLNNLIRGGKFVIEALGIDEQDVIAGTLQLDFDYGINQVVCVLLQGITYICCPFSSKRNNWIKEVSKNGVTIVPAMPFLIERYFVKKRIEEIPSCVRLVTSSGAPFTDKHLESVLDLFPDAKASPMYGLSEGFRATILRQEDYTRKPRSVGLPIGDTDIAIMGDEGNFLGSNQEGEILQSQGCSTWGYYKNPIETKKRFFSFDDLPNRIWIKSGDIGYLDEEGYLYVTGRVESQIKRFGIRISIDEVETAIKEIPGVKEAVVIPMSTNQTESSIYLAVSSDTLQEPELRSKLRKLPVEYFPDKFLLLGELPANYNGGKPDRAAIKEMFLGG